LNEINR